MKALALATILSALATAGVPAAAQGYPARTVQMVVPFAPGGGVDMMGRLMAEALTKRLGQSFVVENRPGAGGLLALEAVANAAPDGYTIAVGSAGSLSVSPSMFPNRNFDPIKRLEPVILFVNSPGVLVARPDMAAASVSDLVQISRQRPGALNVATAGNGSVLQLMGEFFQFREGVKWNSVPYKGAAPALVDLMASRVDVLMADVPSVAAHVKDGRIKAYAVTTTKRARQLPDLPTLEEMGIKGYDMGSWMGLVMPKGTPADIVMKVNAALNDALQSELKDRVAAAGVEPEGGPPDRLAARLAVELPRWTAVIRQANIKPE